MRRLKISQDWWESTFHVYDKKQLRGEVRTASEAFRRQQSSDVQQRGVPEPSRRSKMDAHQGPSSASQDQTVLMQQVFDRLAKVEGMLVASKKPKRPRLETHTESEISDVDADEDPTPPRIPIKGKKSAKRPSISRRI